MSVVLKGYDLGRKDLWEIYWGCIPNAFTAICQNIKTPA